MVKKQAKELDVQTFGTEYINLLKKHDLFDDLETRQNVLLTMLMSPIIRDEKLSDKEKLKKLSDLALKIVSIARQRFLY